MDDNLGQEIQRWQKKLYDCSIRRQRELEQISKLVGNTANQFCLEISSGDGFISSRLRLLGGSWKTAVVTEAAADSIRHTLNETIILIENGKLPFEDNTFDQLVIIDALKNFSDDHKFIHECHRVLKNDGWVIIHEIRRAPVSGVHLLERVFGLLPVAHGARRNGYTVSELFNSLKDGFDVPETILYSNGLLEAAAVIGERIQRSLIKERYWMVRKKVEQDILYRYRRLHSIVSAAYPLLWLISKLEFLPGHRLIVKSRRRRWRPRLQPKLIDGRSIAEAAINTKIGTAAPF